MDGIVDRVSLSTFFGKPYDFISCRPLSVVRMCPNRIHTHINTCCESFGFMRTKVGDFLFELHHYIVILPGKDDTHNLPCGANIVYLLSI